MENRCSSEGPYFNRKAQKIFSETNRKSLTIKHINFIKYVSANRSLARKKFLFAAIKFYFLNTFRFYVTDLIYTYKSRL